MEPKELASSEGVEIVDVREQSEFNAGRIAGARHIPLKTIPGRLQDLPKDKKIVVVCTVGVRSQQAAMFLRNKGFDVENLDGGMKAWAREGLPFTTPEGAEGRII